jgi:hypothetical protein
MDEKCLDCPLRDECNPLFPIVRDFVALAQIFMSITGVTVSIAGEDVPPKGE